ncbi:MAG: M20/M25/M40 family metallo-hydrolase [Elusimicrobiota bacterium]
MSPVVEFLKELVEIPSLSGREEKVAGRLKKEFSELNYDEVIESGGNICGRRGDGNTVVIYDAHMDVVEPGQGWKDDPYKVRMKDKNLIGRGSCDDKGSLAAMVYGGAKADVEGITLYVVGSVREEVAEGNGLKNFFEETEIQPDYIVIGEPSGLKVAFGNRGRLGIKLNITGKAGHASDPEAGENSIYRAVKIIEKVKEINSELKKDSVVVTKVETSNENINIIPEKCTVYCDYRSGVGRSEQEILSAFKKIVKEKDFVEGITPYYKPWKISFDNPLYAAARKTQQQITGSEKTKFWPFCTNGSYTAGDREIPTIGFGPGKEEECHSPEEKIDILEVEKAVEFYSGLPGFIVNEKVK